jgi:integrase
MRIFQRGDTWYIDYVYNGRRYRKRAGHSKRVAELTLKDIELKIERRENLGIQDQKKITFAVFAEEYLKYAKTNKSARTYDLNVGNIRELGPHFNDRLLSEITPQHVERFKADRFAKFTRGKQIRPATVNRDLACLKNMFFKAIEWGYLEKHPMKGVALLKEPPGRLRFLTMEEAGRLLRELPEETGQVVMFALNTGMRKSEILDLQWKNVDMDQRLISVELTKTNERRVVPMNDQVYQLLQNLEKHRAGSELVFPEGRVNIRKNFHAGMKRAGIIDFRLHDCRHSFASHLVMSGASLKVVQQLLGHKDIKMTEGVK